MKYTDKSKSICFLTDNDMNIAGGEQRVISTLLNKLSEQYNVFLICRDKLKNGGYYHIGPQIHVITLDEAPPVKYSAFYARIMRKINYKTGLLEKLGMKNLIRNIRYPDCITREWIAFLNRQDFNCVIGISRWFGELMMLIGDELKAGALAWFHNTYDAYYNTPSCYAYGEKLLLNDASSNIADLVVLTESDAEIYRNLHHIPAVCIPNPLSFQSCEKTDPDQKKMIFAGRMVWEQKGLELLIRVLDIVLPMKTDWTIDIVGDGEDFQRLLDSVQKKKWKNQVNFVGNTNQIIQYYLRASILLLTSRWEGFGLVVTEAMECGLPVVSFDTAGPHEIISSGENGYLIDCYDVKLFSEKVLELMNDSDMRRRFSRNAVLRAQDFSVECIVERWNSVLKE